MRVLWLSAITCNANTHSFLNYPYLEQLLKDFTFLYHPVLESEHSFEDVAAKSLACEILVIEGALSDEFMRGGVSFKELLLHYATQAKALITLGTCASFGGLFKESSYADVHGLHFRGEKAHNRYDSLRPKTVTLPGCPVHPEIIAATLYALKKGFEMPLDALLRPKEFYAYTIHNGCTRNEYFEYKIDNHRFSKLEGCLYYDHGCQGPYSGGSCNKILWNETSSKTRAGVPCFGCTEPTFPKRNLFSTKKNMGIPQYLPLGVPKRAYLSIAGVTKAFTIDRLEKGLLDD